MRSLGHVERFVAGAVGEPGRRTFLLEVHSEAGVEWFVLEKQQVAALAERSIAALRAAGAPLPGPGPDLGVPGESSFRVGEIGIGIEESEATILLSPTEEGIDGVAFSVSLELLGAMAVQAARVVGAGRPPCRFCGLPLDPSGHTCPGSNGDLRHEP
jgi:uncharacterized repeat protein (TIGR03847 family)